MVGTAATTASVTGMGGVLLTSLIMGGDNPVDIEQVGLPTHAVNVDHSILSKWISEEIETYSDEPLTSECTFFNFSRRYESDFCDAFTISRMQTGTMRVASERALRCAAKTSTECVLSSEIGLAIPAAFVAAPESPSGIKVFVAPRTLPLYGDFNLKHVRVTLPGDTFFTRTILMNDTLEVEYMTERKEVKREKITGDEAFCVNLLRIAYESACWTRLDG